MKKLFILLIGLLVFYGLIQLSNPFYFSDEMNKIIIQEEGLE